jgi:hypothetical protein
LCKKIQVRTDAQNSGPQVRTERARRARVVGKKAKSSRYFSPANNAIGRPSAHHDRPHRTWFPNEHHHGLLLLL